MMSKLFVFLLHTFPLILSWLYLLVAVFCVVVHIKQIKNKQKTSVSQCIFSLFNTGYTLLFVITRIFFPAFWEDAFSVLGLIAILISFILSRYKDKRDGKRWWNW